MKIDLRKIFKKPVSLADKNKALFWPGPVERDWKILVSVFAFGLILISLFAWNIYLSDKIAGGYLAPETTVGGASVKTLDKKKLQADLLIMQNRQAAYNKQKTTPLKLIDPAL